jgi:hypothetical protein
MVASARPANILHLAPRTGRMRSVQGPSVSPAERSGGRTHGLLCVRRSLSNMRDGKVMQASVTTCRIPVEKRARNFLYTIRFLLQPGGSPCMRTRGKYRWQSKRQSAGRLWTGRKRYALAGKA